MTGDGWSWKAGSCFGQADYQDLTEVVVPWMSNSGAYQAAVDGWSQGGEEDSQTPAAVASRTHSPEVSTAVELPAPISASTPSFHPLSPRSYRSSSPSARRWKQIKYAGLSFRRRLNTRYWGKGNDLSIWMT